MTVHAVRLREPRSEDAPSTGFSQDPNRTFNPEQRVR
jgi:hypothetical protein